MAKKSVEKLTLAVQLENGVNSSGAAVSKTYSYNSIKTDAAAEALLTVGNSLAGLFSHSLEGVYTTEKSLLSAE